MNEIFISKSVIFFMALWALGLLLLMFRPRVEILWKIMAVLLFLFYIWFNFDDLQNGYNQILKDWYPFTINFLKELLVLTFTNLFFIWPIALVIIFYKADDLGAERLLKFMILITLVLWVVFIIYTFYSKGIDTFLLEKLKKMIPYAK
jgi:hypothetical protein